MTLITFVQVFTVCLLGAMSPGPSMVIVINNSLFKNKIHGYFTSIGHGIGISLYAVIAILSLNLILIINSQIFIWIRLISVLFLIYLGFKILTTKSKLKFENNSYVKNSYFISFIQGLGISLLNPKIFVWFTAVYSNFINPNNDNIFNFYLVIIAGFTDAGWYFLLATIISSTFVFNKVKNKIFFLEKIVGYTLIIIGILISLDLFIL